MLHKIPVFTRILCALPALLCLCTCLCGGIHPTSESILPAVTEDGGAGEWHLCLTVSDSDPHNPSLILALKGQLPPHADPSAVAAVRIAVELPDVWRVTAVERQGTADGSLTITVSAEGSRAVILADGELKDLVGLAFFLTAEAVVGNMVPSICATAHSEGVAYYDATDCAVVSIPVTGAQLDVAPWDGEWDTSPEESATAPPASEVPTTTPPANDEKSPVTATLVGCQETPCIDGKFSVRFIYKIAGGAAGKGTPLDTGVVCLVGRGVIEADVTAAATVTAWEGCVSTVTVADTTAHATTTMGGEEGAYFLLVTFRELDARGTWVFRAERGDGKRVIIYWQDGNFLGSTNAKLPKTKNRFW